MFWGKVSLADRTVHPDLIAKTPKCLPAQSSLVSKRLPATRAEPSHHGNRTTHPHLVRSRASSATTLPFITAKAMRPQSIATRPPPPYNRTAEAAVMSDLCPIRSLAAASMMIRMRIWAKSRLVTRHLMAWAFQAITMIGGLPSPARRLSPLLDPNRVWAINTRRSFMGSSAKIHTTMDSRTMAVPVGTTLRRAR